MSVLFLSLRAVLPLVALACPVAAAPTVVTTNPPPGTVTTLTSVSITFSEPVSGVDLADLQVNGDNAASVTGAGAGPYVFTFTQPPPGTVSASWESDHGIAGIGTGPFATPGAWSYTLTDSIPPTVGKIRTSVAGQEMDALFPTPGSTVAALTQASVTFSEPVSGVDAADLLINGTPANAVSGAAAGPYVFTFPQPADGAVAFQWAGSTGIMDSAANGFAGGTWNVTKAASLGTVVITEFLAANAGAVATTVNGTRDENFDLSPWIELTNTGTTSVDLTGWSLTNDYDPAAEGSPERWNQPDQWIMPARTLAAGARLVIWASGKDRKPVSGHLHTNFSLNPSGGSLSLFKPDSPRGDAVSSFRQYPGQRYDYSYGLQSADNAIRYFSPPSVTQTAYVLPTSANPAPPPPAIPLGAVNNASTLTAVTQKPAASVTRGYFDEPFQVILSCATAGAAIRYTLNGTPPTAASADYTAPLTVSASSVLRFAAFGTGMVPSETVTHTYLFLDNVVNQPGPPYDNPANANDNANPQPPSVGGTALPVAWGTNGTGSFPGLITNLSASQVPADYGMDPKVYADPTLYDDTGAVNAAGRTNLSRIKQGLRDLPMVSVVMRPDDMWGAGGLYPTASESDHSDRTKACSLEMIEPDGTTGFQVDCGIDLHGNASRAPYKNPKHGFTLRFKGKYGSGKVEANLFPDSPVREWDKLVLRGDFNSSWLHQNGSPGIAAGSDSYQRPRGIRIRDAWCKDTFRDMGHAAGHHRFANLFINGLFWGTYELAEDEADDFGASYFGGEKADYDVIDQGTLKSGTWTAYYAMKGILGWTGATFTTAPVFTTPFTNAQYEQIKQYLDVPWFIDYMVLHFFTGHRDWGTTTDYNKNWYVIRHKSGTFKYLPWDQENLLWHESEDRVSGASSTSPSIYPPTAIHPRLKSNAQYLLDFADRVHRQCVMPGGALTPAANIARLNKWASIMNANAMCLESARWGDYRYKVHAYTLGTFSEVYSWNGRWYENGTLRSNTANTNNWMSEINRLKNTYFPARTNNLIVQLRNNGLYPALNAPEFRNNNDNALTGDQRVTAGYQMKMQLPAPAPADTVSFGTIYYTLDGSDPRVPYTTTGERTASAVAYAAPLTINSTTTVKARTLNGTTWSALMEATFSTGSAIPAIVISEIYYNPRGIHGGTSAEFIEILNAGATDVDLSGWYFEGVDFIIPQGRVLGAGDRMVIANNNAPAVFAQQYPGVVVAGYFSGALDNTGERITLFDKSGHRVFSVEYDDGVPWPIAADNGGSSMELIDPAGDPQSPHNWIASSVQKGTPGTGASQVASAVIISEFMAADGKGPVPDFVELYNQSAAPVNIGNWVVQGQVVPPNTTLAADARLLIQAGPGALSAIKIPLPLSAVFGDIRLQDSSLTAVDGVRYGPQVLGTSFNRGGSGWTLGIPTPGTANTAAPVAAPLSLRINEILADPVPGEDDWIEFYDTDTVNAAVLTGCSLERNGGYFRITAPVAVAAGGYVRLYCDPGNVRADNLNLDLPGAGASLTLRNAAWETVDSLSYGTQQQAVSQGRIDGNPALVALPYPSPGASNILLPANHPVLNELLIINRNGDNAPWARRPSWIELKNPAASALDLGGWSVRTRFAEFETAVFPAGTLISAGGLLAVWCDPQQPSGLSTGGHLNVPLTINEIQSRWSLELVDPSGHIHDRISWGRQIPDLSIGRLPGDSWALLAAPTRGTPNASAAALTPATDLKINEWANAVTPGAFSFIELYNPGIVPASAGGLWLSDEPGEARRKKWQIPELTFIAGHGLSLFTSGNSTASPVRYLFDLSPDGEYVRLSQNNAAATAVDSFNFGLAPPSPQTQGRLPDGAANVVSLRATPGTPNSTTPGPVIYDQPDSAAASAGKPFGLSVASNGSSGQWFRNGQPISGQTAPTLSLPNVTSADEGDYTFSSTNADGTTLSEVARLTILYTYTAWASEKGIGPLNADADNDGISNGDEFLAGTDPLVPASPEERLTRHTTAGSESIAGTPYLTMDFTLSRRAAFSTLTGEASTSLSPWTATLPDFTQVRSTDPNGDQRLRYKFASPGQRRFLRLRLTP